MKRIVTFFLAVGLMGVPVASAQSGGNPWANQFSPGQAREAVREGKTVPLNKIFQKLKREYGGYQLGAELYSREDGTTFYEIDWMTEDGRKAHFTVDAQSGSVLERHGG
ncbi:PepSY domain-containing protein [Hyphomonas sp. WL0036]|uniref:PepSY domain-containing protein n=1 Tax=Hyphomonas sediminis TaxID=2866160 RepID=UPI001C813D6A|nr:PepSY domain-containing protein [Hyphomonas sediminis]MBY9067298.1 PepSY domain-containing protein [Hyphomonas sediminis]